jgi:hypothetical protein
MSDGAKINARWGSAWPTDIADPRDPGHEFSPVLMAPVANLLGAPWRLESESPGGAFVIWLDVQHGTYAGGTGSGSVRNSPETGWCGGRSSCRPLAGTRWRTTTNS